VQRAREAFRNGDAGLNAASREYPVPKVTQKGHFDGKNYVAAGSIQLLISD
jgi:hypothetical protein